MAGNRLLFAPVHSVRHRASFDRERLPFTLCSMLLNDSPWATDRWICYPTLCRTRFLVRAILLISVTWRNRVDDLLMTLDNGEENGGSETMYLTRHLTREGVRWACDGQWLPAGFRLSWLLELPAATARGLLAMLPRGERASGPLLAPIDPEQEVWAAGVTYLRSRDARMAEAQVKDIYWRVYEAERPELFLKGQGWRMVGPGKPVRVRRDSRWNVPEPELAVVFTQSLEPFGYTVGNDVSSRDIEGENPLYLPQAKVYDGAGALGPGIVVIECADELHDVPVAMELYRGDTLVYRGETTTARMKRPPEELLAWLGRELRFPWGGVLMTGTGIVPPDDFSLAPGDRVVIRVGELVLDNPVG